MSVLVEDLQKKRLSFMFLAHGRRACLETYFMVNFTPYKKFKSMYLAAMSRTPSPLSEVKKFYRSLKNVKKDLVIGQIVSSTAVFRNYPGVIVDKSEGRLLLEYRFDIKPEKPYRIWVQRNDVTADPDQINMEVI